MYTLKVWKFEHSQPMIWTRKTWRDAWFVATQMDYAKVQVVSEESGIIELETRR